MTFLVQDLERRGRVVMQDFVLLGQGGQSGLNVPSPAEEVVGVV